MITDSASHPLRYAIPFRCLQADANQLARGLRESVLDGLTARSGAALWGPTGTGKTYAMVAAMREVAKADAPFKDCALFVDWPEFVSDCDAWKAMTASDRDRFNPAKRLLEWRGPLFVDDVGQEQIVDSGFRKGETEALFDQFVNRRTGLQLPLWLTSNLSASDIRKRYGERCVSRLTEHCAWISVVGDDRRLVAV